MIMEILECTVGAVDASIMRATAAAARPVVSAARPRLLPTVRSHSMAGVGLYEVQGQDTSGWAGHVADNNKGVVLGIDPTAFPTRLGPPPDRPPVN